MTDQTYWMRAIDMYGESLCKPVRVKGSIYEAESGYHFIATKRAILVPHTPGLLARLRYIDPATGLELPEESHPTWPLSVGGCQLVRGHAMGISSGRLGVKLPWYTPPDPVEQLVAQLPKRAPRPKAEPVEGSPVPAPLGPWTGGSHWEEPIPPPLFNPTRQPDGTVIPIPPRAVPWMIAQYMVADGTVVSGSQLTHAQRLAAVRIEEIDEANQAVDDI